MGTRRTFKPQIMNSHTRMTAEMAIMTLHSNAARLRMARGMRAPKKERGGKRHGQYDSDHRDDDRNSSVLVHGLRHLFALNEFDDTADAFDKRGCSADYS